MDITLWIIMACMLLSAGVIVKGPSIWDRLLGMNLVSTKIILIIIMFASFSGIPYLLDFAIIYALTGFICTIFIALFLLEHNRKRKNRGKQEEENIDADQ